MPQASTQQFVDRSVGPLSAPLVSNGNVQSHLKRWLNWQCCSIDGVLQATLFTIKPASKQVYADQGQATWPSSLKPAIELLTGANSAAKKRKVTITKLVGVQSAEQHLECISIPLPSKKPRYVLSILTAPQTQKRQMELIKLINWGSHWLLERRSPSVDHDKGALRDVLEKTLITKCIASQSAEEMVYIVIAQIAEAYRCERVSMGLIQGDRVYVKGISGLPRFDSRMRLVRRIESAMEEANELQVRVDTSQPQTDAPHPRHIDLAAEHSGKVISVLLRDTDSTLGILTLEFKATGLHDTVDVESLEPLCKQITIVLRMRLSNELSLVKQARERTGKYFHRLISPPYQLRNYVKLFVSVGSLLVLLASLFFEGEYRITSRAVIEGNDKQMVVAPYSGFIQASDVRSGDIVTKQDVIATLDVSDLQVEKDKRLSELSKVEKNYAQALAEGNRVELSLSVALRDEINAELALVDQQIERSQIRAPFSGVIVSGDLNQMLGAPVEQGDLLFELASLEQFRLILDIEERDIAQVQSGQTATLRLASIPGQSLSATLKTVLPVAVIAQGKNVFRMQAELAEISHLLRPGMQGIARISAGQRSWFWLLTHKLFHQIRIWFWSLSL